jgi:hypothetical protein
MSIYMFLFYLVFARLNLVCFSKMTTDCFGNHKNKLFLIIKIELV